MTDRAHDVVADCVLFSTADWDEPYWTNKQHTASILASRGWRVLYVESVGFRAPKVGSGRDWARLWRRLWRGMQSLMLGPARRAPNVWVLSPLMVPAKHHWPLLRALNQALLRWTVTRFTRGSRFVAPVVWTYHPYMLDAISRLSRGPLVYHCVDDIGAIPGVDVDAFELAQRELLAGCDAVFTTATALLDKCRPYNANTHFFGNVVDADHFGAALQDAGPLPAELAAIPTPRIVYHGVLSDFKVDFALLHDAARMRPDWHWVLIGEEREGQRSDLAARVAALPNVHRLGYRSYDTLPAYLRGMQVGMLPTLLNDYTRSMFPMKFYEYLAAGLPVVSTPLDFAKVSRPGLLTGGDAASFVAAIDAQLARGRLEPDEVREAVGDNTWERRLDKMLAITFGRDDVRARFGGVA
ncbi:glycosyl transferase family 1 [Burkholderia diffusa]|uniref:Glycosyl transferase family 1 n=1 Tax=Burkholderia diffusa TaxID=488732 RepID=A0AAW3PK84_9BURK|nr:glycosyltransferase [Burkholderia diffusa]KVH47204.1 glycosyl transferase family 1 [Burkholderia diffusa]KWF27804.1 glycosyl transferase family 1 [Burkholderia diffusa]KWF31606.1 glycosyl transferase family 1 [Burkholderia diffusa]KWF42947.1 glycosyl transferase family 1 [Burkholderia diffusa]KWF57207.1 glycosyl transferase family 1 [Burkholderia diffusa]